MLQQSFLALDLPASHFDGVFANAALFHVPSQELPRVLAALRQTLKPGGVLSDGTRDPWWPEALSQAVAMPTVRARAKQRTTRP